MRMSATRQVNLVATAVLLCCMAGGIATLNAIDHLRRGSVAQEALYVRSSTVLRRMSLGYTGLLADIYWTRAVQYFGEQHHSGSGDFRLLAPLISACWHRCWTSRRNWIRSSCQRTSLGRIFWLRNHPMARDCRGRRSR